MSEGTQTEGNVLASIKQQYDDLKKIVSDAQSALAEAELRLNTFRTNTMAVLEVASAHKSGQAMRAERQAQVAQMFEQGVTRAEIVRRTGLPDHLVGYDIDCIRRRRLKGTGAKRTSASEKAPEPNSDSELPVEVEENAQEVSGETEEPEVTANDDKDLDKDEDAEDDENDEPGATLKELQVEWTKRAGGRKLSVIEFKTTSDEGHIHTVSLTSLGNGRTSEAHGHAHTVNQFDVSETEDHVHGLTLEQVTQAPISVYAAKGLSKQGSVKPGCSISREALKMLAKDFQKGKRRTLTFVTTEDGGPSGSPHHHVANLDAMGDGETKKDGTGHVHKFCRFSIAVGGADHDHGLTGDEESSK
jgi:transposase-like protein